MKWLLILLLLSSFAYAECRELTDGAKISESVTLCSSTYDIPSGVTIVANNVVFDCGTAVLRGISDQSEIGVRAEDVENITIKNCNILTFDQGLYLKNVTHSLIEKNGFLKNRIGVRMLNAYENVIKDNNDKSHQLAVSAIASKFNIVMLGNKNIERSFCEVNACNEIRDMNVCESGDFYCSKKCSAETDSDCAQPVKEESVNITPAKSVDEIVAEVREEVEKNQSVNKSEVQKEQRKGVSFGAKILIYAALYAIVFLILRVVKKRHK